MLQAIPAMRSDFDVFLLIASRKWQNIDSIVHLLVQFTDGYD